MDSLHCLWILQLSKNTLWRCSEIALTFSTSTLAQLEAELNGFGNILWRESATPWFGKVDHLIKMPTAWSSPKRVQEALDSEVLCAQKLMLSSARKLEIKRKMVYFIFVYLS